MEVVEASMRWEAFIGIAFGWGVGFSTLLVDETFKHNMNKKRKQLLHYNLLGVVQFMLHT